MTDEKKYRTEVPNIIDDLGLDPYERTLYVHYKRVCGASGGQCTEGVRTIASKTKMSVGKITKARTVLLERGLIAGAVQHGKDSAITVIDIWELNTIYYGEKTRPSIDGWTVKQLKHWADNCSPGEQLNGHQAGLPELFAPNCSQDEQHCSPGELKKEPSKKLTPNGVGSKPPEGPKKRDGPRWELMTEFIALTGIPIPEDKPGEKYWWSQIGVIYGIVKQDSKTGKKLMKEAFERLGRENVYDPGSLVKTIRQTMAARTNKPKMRLT